MSNCFRATVDISCSEKVSKKVKENICYSAPKQTMHHRSAQVHWAHQAVSDTPAL